MIDDRSARLALPLLHAAQAQKEIAHNEALALLDLAVQAQVVASGSDEPPDAPMAGECWIVGSAPQGEWTGHAGAIAGWTGSGWRFVPAREGMRAWDVGAGVMLMRHAGAWEAGVVRGTRFLAGGEQVVGTRQPAISPPAGGAIVDAEARAVLGEILAALRAHGLIGAEA